MKQFLLLFVASLLLGLNSMAQAVNQMSFLEGNPIWVYKYEHIPTPRDQFMKCWVDVGDRCYFYYFLAGQKEINNKTYAMMGEVQCDREGEINLNRRLPVREDNGIVYTITDSLPGVVEYYYYDDLPVPYLQQGDECVLYNFGAKTDEDLYENVKVKSYGTYCLMDGTECRVLKTNGPSLYEKLGILSSDPEFGIMDPFCETPIATNGHAYAKQLNAYYQNNTMLYKAPDAPEGLCLDDTIKTSLDDAYIYARSYKTNPFHEKTMSYIRNLQMTTNIRIPQGNNSKNTPVLFFDLQGRRIGKAQEGINIIRNADGTTKKVLIKR